MKKILALLMIFAVSLSLFACGKVDGDGKENTTGNTAQGRGENGFSAMQIKMPALHFHAKRAMECEAPASTVWKS